MKRKTIGLLAAAALLSVTVSGIGTAHAYFTSYVQAQGRRQIHLGDTTTFEEEVVGRDKKVKITNSSTSNKPVWVRVKAFAGAEYVKGLTYTGNKGVWEENKEDGFWYYKEPLLPGKTTEDLTVSIGNWPKAESLENLNEKFNVIVVYETTPAVENGEDKDGNVQYVERTQADWQRGITKMVTEEGTK